MVEFIYPTRYDPANSKPHDGTRPIIPVQMMLPNNEWSETVLFNFDTGASSPTDIPLQLLDDFGYKEIANGKTRPTYKKKMRIPDSGLPDFWLDCMLQNKAHYDLFREQKNRYPLLRVRDLVMTDYFSIVYNLQNTVIRTKEMDVPEIRKTGTVRLPDAMKRSGTPTSSWYWWKVKFRNPRKTSQTETDWFQHCTGDYKIILKKDTAEEIDLKLESKIDSENWNSHVTMEFTEAKPVNNAKLINAATTVRSMDADYARGGDPRNFGGGIEILKKWSVVIKGMERYYVPVLG